MKLKSKISDLGLTEGKEYEILEESCGYYKVIIDNGNKTWRFKYCFEEGENATIHNSQGHNENV
jgi:hypothetical protein